MVEFTCENVNKVVDEEQTYLLLYLCQTYTIKCIGYIRGCKLVFNKFI